MKKIIAIILLLCFCISATSCKTKLIDNEIAQPNNENASSSGQSVAVENDEVKQEQQSPERETNTKTETQTSNSDTQTDASSNETENNKKTEDEEDIFIIQGETMIETCPPITVDLRLACVLGTDMFTAKVVDSKPLPEGTEFLSIETLDNIPVLYTVEVQEVYKDFIVTPKSTIQVVDYMIENGTDDNWDNALEIGKTYLFGGWAEPYGKKPIIVCHGLHSAQIKDDGTLEYCSSNAELSLKGISTLNDIITNETVSDIIYSKTDSVLLYESFYELIDGVSDDTAVIDYLKEAIKIDSDKVLKTPETAEK